MKLLNLLLTTVLGLLLFAPASAAQSPAQVAQDAFKRIQAERADTVADMEATFEKGVARMKSLAKSGASRVEIEQAADKAMRGLDLRAKQGAQTLLGIRDDAVAALEHMLAPPYLIKRLDRAASRALDVVTMRHYALWTELQQLRAKLT